MKRKGWFHLFFLATVAASTLACSSSNSGDGGGDAGSAKDSGVHASSCGDPGDVGNSLGVGKYCQVSDTCASNKVATICSAVANGTELSTTYSYFCTIPCDPSKAGFCGEGAGCACTSVGCGCSPLACAIDAGAQLDAGLSSTGDAGSDAGDAGSD